MILDILDGVCSIEFPKQAQELSAPVVSRRISVESLRFLS